MDINAGRMITEGLSVEEMGEYCVEYLLEVINGKLTMAEVHGNGGSLCIYQTTRPF